MGQTASNFDYVWPGAPNGNTIVVKTVTFAQGGSSVPGPRQIVGVYRPNTTDYAADFSAAAGWTPISNTITDATGNVIIAPGAVASKYVNQESASRVDTRMKAGYVFYYLDGDPQSTGDAGGPIGWMAIFSDGSGMKNVSGVTITRGFAARPPSTVVSSSAQADATDYAWGLKKLAAMGSTLSVVATPSPSTSPTLSKAVQPSVALTPAAPSSNHYALYAGLAVAAVGAFMLLGD
jgi:hypothetical protein